MKIEKAIEILTEDINHPTAQFMPELQEAEKLGIEALKRIREIRPFGNNPGISYLPGETED